MLGLISKLVRYCPGIFLGLRKRANGKVLFFFFQIDTPPKTYCARKRSGTFIAYHEQERFFSGQRMKSVYIPVTVLK